jgi:hypothetical protein
MTTMKTKREMLVLAGGATALAVAGGCTQTQVTDTEKQIAALINQVQAGVVAACASAGKIVPTANTVLQVLLSIVGGTNALAATAAMIAQAITDIAAAGCPTPTGTKTATTSKGVPIVFY